MKSDWKTGRVQAKWRGEVPLDLARLRATVLAWRGGVRLAGIDVLATGTLVTWKGGVALRADGTGQLFALRAAPAVTLPEPGGRARLVGEASLPEKSQAGVGAVLTVREVERLSTGSSR